MTGSSNLPCLITDKVWQDSVFRILFQSQVQLNTQNLLLLTQVPIKYREHYEKLLQEEKRIFFNESNNLWFSSHKQSFMEDRPLSESTFVVTDIEATGISASKQNRIIEIAAVKFTGSGEIDYFESLVNPQEVQPSRFVIKMTDIKPAMLEKAPSIEEVLPRYLDFLGSGIFTAHNAKFDAGMINFEMNRLSLPENKKINIDLCSLSLAKKLLKDVSHYGLKGLTEHFGYKHENMHRAMSDAKATKFCLDRLLVMLEKEKIYTIFELLDYVYSSQNMHSLNRKIKKRKIALKNNAR